MMVASLNAGDMEGATLVTETGSTDIAELLAGRPLIARRFTEMVNRAGLYNPSIELTLLDAAQPNAAFVPAVLRPGGTLRLTTGLVRLLDDRELLAIIGHELGHARHKAKHILFSIEPGILSTVGGGIASALWVTDPSDSRDRFTRRSLLRKSAMVTAAGIGLDALNPGAFSLRRSLAQSTEYEADREGIQLSGDAEAFISALRKTYRWYEKNGVSLDSKPSNHPTLEDRIRWISRLGGLTR
jgi:Zn-dependent protease with chaperone function